ncbi:MAG TPA: isoprenylcysteine carboxylmethyltransferase family protein [Streptosporangiaceae bacterium]|nr:isoprenylcysteine carboxylmethyltransferase family protein [Streptosporangiaceae bacterium]
MLVGLTTLAWLALEIGMLIRDRVRGTGRMTQDRGTLVLNFLVITAALLAGVAQGMLRGDPAWQFGSRPLAAAGLLLMWSGLTLRIWAIRVLGRSFRMTVEVDPGQQVVDRGPYRWLRHPSYTGILLITTGLGLAYGNWLSPGLLVVLPAAVTTRRIFVEEAVLTGVLGQPYADYRTRTKRLVPGLW